MSSILLRQVVSTEIESVLPILRDADEGEQRVRDTLMDGVHLSYAAFDDGRLVGAATMYWKQNESEIRYIAVAPEMRGKGYGKAMIAALLEEARRRGVHALLVGTATCSFDNLAFYQKCGFRMDYIRRDYFAYIQPPVMENGIPLRDMVVLRYDLGKSTL